MNFIRFLSLHSYLKFISAIIIKILFTSWNAIEPDEDEDDMTPEEILLQAQKAAKDAADRLTLKRPNSKVSFL